MYIGATDEPRNRGRPTDIARAGRDPSQSRLSIPRNTTPVPSQPRDSEPQGAGQGTRDIDGDQRNREENTPMEEL